MSQTLAVTFAALGEIHPESGVDTLIVFAGEDLALSAATRSLLGPAADLVKRAATTA